MLNAIQKLKISVLLLALLLVGGVGVARANVGGVGDAVCTALSSHLVAHADSPQSEAVVSYLLEKCAESSLGGFGPAEAFTNPTKVRGLLIFDADSKLSDGLVCKSATFPSTSSTFMSLRNDADPPWVVEVVKLRTNRAASAAVILSAGTSTVSAVAFDAARTATGTIPWGFIDRYYITSAAGQDGNVFVSNHFNGTSTVAGSNDAGSVIRGPETVGSANGGATNPVLRVGRNREALGIVRPDEYFLATIELGQYGASGGYRWAVTTTASTSPATDATSVNLRESGNVGLTGTLTVCYSYLTSSTPL